MTSVVADILCIKSLFRELNIKIVTAPRVLCDNQGAFFLSANPILHAKTKHLELDLHFVREKAIRGEIQVQHIPASAQIADGFTKPLSSVSFEDFRQNLGVREYIKLKGTIRDKG